MENPNEKILAEDGPKQKRLVIKLTEYERHPLLELRYWYLDKKSGEFKPTRKGVNLTRANYQAFKNVIDRHNEEVMDWLKVGYVPEHVEKYGDSQDKALSENKHIPSSIEVEYETAPSLSYFFKVKHSGGRDELVLNESHPFVNGLKELESNGENGVELTKLVRELLVSYGRAKSALGDAPATHPDILFDQLEFDWSAHLKRYIEDR